MSTVLDQKFEHFHKTHPEVYTSLLRLSRNWVAAHGNSRLGIAAIYEVARWEIIWETGDPEFKLNNNYRAYYARLLMMEPGLYGLFELRDSGADDWLAEKARLHA
jgi:hypothetical protein